MWGQTQWVSIGARQVIEAAEWSPEGHSSGSGGLTVLQALVRDTCLIVTHADMLIKMIAGVQGQEVNATLARSIRQVLKMESQHSASVTPRVLTLHSILVGSMIQCTALVLEDGPHRRMYGAAAGRDPAYLYTHLPLAGQSPLLGNAVPMMVAGHVFNPLRVRRRTRTVYELEEREAVS